jgi:twinkle protein
MAQLDESIARIDVARARKVGQMLVGTADPAYEKDPELLVDPLSLDGKSLLEEFATDFAKFSTTPFDPRGDRLRLYSGGVTIWSGFPGAGKTTLLRQLACHLLLEQRGGVFFASLEEHPKHLLVRIAATAAGRELPNAHQMQWFIDEYGQRFKVWARIGLAEHRKLLAVVRKLAEQGITHAIIDSLMCLDVNNGDFEAQRQFANLLATTARASGVHIHLVAHPRKLISADQEPDINDVAGAREIGGIADNVIFVRRSKDEPNNPSAAATPMCISIRKQRHGYGVLGDVVGWFHRPMRQFSTEQFPSRAVRYLPPDAYVSYP